MEDLGLLHGGRLHYGMLGGIICGLIGFIVNIIIDADDTVWPVAIILGAIIGWQINKRLMVKDIHLEIAEERTKDRHGVVNDALALYGKDAENGMLRAQYKLGISYFEGEGIEKNNVQAYKWISLSKRGSYGSDYIRVMEIKLKKLKKQMTATQLAEAKLLIDQFKKY